MITNLLAGLAAVGLLTAGVAATTETRSSIAITPAAVAPNAARTLAVRSVAQATNRPDCTLESNASLPECVSHGARDAALVGSSGHGMSGIVLGVLALGGIGAAVAAGAKSDSNG